MRASRRPSLRRFLESGPANADHSVLLIPGTLGTAAFFEELMAEPKLGESSVRLVATTLPGYGGTAPTEDVSIEGYARAATKLAADLGCDVVLGHSTGGDVAAAHIRLTTSPIRSFSANPPSVSVMSEQLRAQKETFTICPSRHSSFDVWSRFCCRT